MKTFYKPDEMESDDLDELEEQNETNDDILIGFADEGDEVEIGGVVLAEATDSDDSFSENDSIEESDFIVDTTDNDDDDDDDDDTMKNSNQGSNETQRHRNSADAAASTSADAEEGDDVIAKILANTKTLRTHPPTISIDDYVVDLSFHPTEDILAAGTISGDAVIYKYSVDGNVLANTLELHVKAIRDIEFNHDGNVLYSASKDRSILMTDMETGKFIRCYEQAHEQPVSQMNVFDENLFATGDDDGTVKVWDIREKGNNPIFSLKEVDDYITSILTNDAKKMLLTTSGDGYLTAINIGSRKLSVQSEPYDEELTCMGLFRNDSKLVVGTSKGRLYTFNWNEFGYHNTMYPGPKTPMSHMIPVTDRVAVVAGEEGVLRALHCIPGRNLGVVGQHSLAVDAMDIDQSGEYIASSADNNEIKFWNIKYFEDLDDIKYNEKHNKSKEKNHNLPSSKRENAGDFFSDLI
ncbi:WD repeat-containing protein 55 homolog [Sitodiplosis mosellana]|uniref:WD repeat-containing protein 55 homolog n=1 Tax=Sitodiplosis mosellana TaxID=263140 RepID=UPI002443B7EA|nr:WD repeat-containing protein 55 homolog [Sitodiplosis mosellana]